MYSKKIQLLLKRRKISVYDFVEVTSKGFKVKGCVMPRTAGRPDTLVIKKENGYNIGIKPDSVKKLRSLKKRKHTGFKFKKNLNKKDVVILAAGGTIASRIDYRTGAVKPAMTADEIIRFTPGISDVANIRVRVLFQMLSECMTPYQWSIIAKGVSKAIKEGADGVVVMHGTDIMGYTAAFLSFALQDLPVPVVLVGAQRSTDRASCDTHVNITCAVKAATSDIAEVMVCMHEGLNDDCCILHQGTRVRKCHTSRRDAFRSIGVKPFACIKYPELSVGFLRDDYARVDKSRKLVLKAKFDDRVALLKVVPGLKPDIIKSLKNYRGLVIEGTGLGHLPITGYGDKYTEMNVLNFKALKEFSGKGVVFMTPQAINGRINMNVYETGRDLIDIGVLGNLCDVIPETAYVKLVWALGNSRTVKEAKELMMTNIAGEFTERSMVS